MEGLGINLPQIVFYLISFGVALVVLQMYVFKPVAQIMTDREDAIKKSFAEKAEIETQHARIDAEVQTILNQAHEEARGIIDSAKLQVEPTKQDILAGATRSGNAIVIAAQKQAEEIVANGRKQAETDSIEVLRKLIKKSLSNMQLSPEISDKALEQIITKL